MLQRSLHGQIQGLFLLLTRRQELSLALFSFLFFPGVLLHETSHYLTARLLAVPTGRFSLLPRVLANGRVRLGYVETGRADPLRETLIGAAPLVFGGLFVAYAGLVKLQIAALGQAWQLGGQAAVWQALPGVVQQPDFWLWFYLAFVVSSTMLPSASDRQAWLPLAAWIGLLLALVLLAGAGPWLQANAAPPLNRALRAVAATFAISCGLHLCLLPPFWSLARLAEHLTGYHLVHG